LFHQLGVSGIRSTPGNTTKDEARYFEALSLSKASNPAAAKLIWRQLASDPRSYYGARSAEKLGQRSGLSQTGICDSTGDQVLVDALTDLTAARRPLRAETETATDLVSELMFLQLWDEASVWMDRSKTRPDNRVAAQLAYAAGRYHRSIAYADRLANGDKKALGLAYPAGFHEQICAVAQKYNTDPLWLHAIIWQESKYNPFARSGASARGLMQFIPETANEVGRAIGIAEFSLNKLYDPAVNIPMGAYYFSSLLAELKSPAMALAAYNGGIDNVRRWKSKWPEGDEEFFVSDIGFVETKRYVQAVYGARAAYGSK
jgi:soluble lytic murein transglycosylase